MMRLETPFVFDGDLIILTTMIPELADLIGYSARDGFKQTKVHTAIGEEHGYWLRVADWPSRKR